MTYRELIEQHLDAGEVFADIVYMTGLPLDLDTPIPKWWGDIESFAFWTAQSVYISHYNEGFGIIRAPRNPMDRSPDGYVWSELK